MYASSEYNPGTDWHEYAFEWTPDYVAWFYDGQEVNRKTDTNSVDDLDKEQRLMMNFWTPTFDKWGNGFSNTGMPWYAKYDYVETYTWNGSGFDFHWRDDFDSFDDSRWYKSDGWSFAGNSTTFYASQVYTEGGALVLKME